VDRDEPSPASNLTGVPLNRADTAVADAEVQRVIWDESQVARSLQTSGQKIDEY